MVHENGRQLYLHQFQRSRLLEHEYNLRNNGNGQSQVVGLLLKFRGLLYRYPKFLRQQAFQDLLLNDQQFLKVYLSVPLVRLYSMLLSLCALHLARVRYLRH
ncbi:hypothetical protein D9M71_685100 [compost metagenome]